MHVATQLIKTWNLIWNLHHAWVACYEPNNKMSLLTRIFSSRTAYFRKVCLYLASFNFFFMFEMLYLQTLYCTFSLSWVLYILDAVRSVLYLQEIYEDKPTKRTDLFCYRWSWFEARSNICWAKRQEKLRGKNKVKFSTSSKRISLVCNILVYCEGVDFEVTGIKSDVWLTVHRNSVRIRNQLDVTYVLSFISPLQVAQHVLGNHLPIFRRWWLRGVIATCWYCAVTMSGIIQICLSVRVDMFYVYLVTGVKFMTVFITRRDAACF